MTATAIFNDHLDLLNIGSFTHVAIDAHINDATIHYPMAAIDHGVIGGLGDDDHLQYLLLAGRAGGQVAFGGTAATERLTLRGSTNADLGVIDAASPMSFTGDWIVASPQLAQLDHQSIVPSSGGAVTGFILDSPEIHIDNGLFIYYSLANTGLYIQDVAAGFAVQTLFLAQPTYRSETAAIAPPQAFIFAAQAAMQTLGCGAVTTPNHIGLSYAPRIITSVAGDSLTVTDHIGMAVGPSWSTVAGTTANFGKLTGLRMTQPVRGLFAPTGGVETMTEVRGIDFLNMTLGGNIPRAAVYCQLNSVFALNRCINNVGGAESDFGVGDIHLNDDTYLKMGATLANPDVIQGWATAQSAVVYSSFFGLGANPLYLRPSSTDTWTFQQNNGGALDIGLGFNVNAVSFGVIDPVPNSNNWFVMFAGPNQRQVQIGGEYSDVLWTASGSIDVNGQVVSELQAFKINVPAVILNGGTIQDMSNLRVASQPSFGATRVQAVWVSGRTRIDGYMNNGSRAIGSFGANQNNLQIAQNNNQRTMCLITPTANINITGFDSSFGWAQGGDRICIINDGAFNLTITHQDAASLAANRVITSTGVAYILGPNEIVWLWYDDTGTARWRMLEGTGA